MQRFCIAGGVVSEFTANFIRRQHFLSDFSLAFLRLALNIPVLYMDANSTQSSGMYDAMVWLEKDNNWKKLAAAVVLIIVAVAAFAFFKWNKEKTELDANRTLLSLTARAETDQTVTAEDFTKVAQQHANTAAAERAQLLAATTAFDKGDFAKAASGFETVQKSANDKTVKAQAAFGLAAVAEAQQNLDQALQKYEEVSKQYPKENVAPQAKLAIGRIYELQSKPEQALKNYSEIENSANEFQYWKGEAAERRDRLESRFPNLKKADEQVFEVTTPPAPAATNK